MKNHTFSHPKMEIFANEEEGVATILLYGDIGPTDWWREDAGIIDAAFSKVFDAYDKKGKQIHIRINGHGGHIDHGQAIISRIQRANADVHVFNDGFAASMSCALLFSVPSARRHIPSHSVTHFHSPMTGVYGNENTLRDAADMLAVFGTAVKTLVKQNSNISDEDIDVLFSGKDYFLTAEQAKEKGLIDVIADYTIDKDKVKQQLLDAAKLSGTQIDKFFTHENKTPEMSIVELKNALKEGKLTQEEVEQVLEELKPKASKDAEALKGSIDSLKDLVSGLKTELEGLKAQAAEMHTAIKDAPPIKPEGGEIEMSYEKGGVFPSK